MRDIKEIIANNLVELRKKNNMTQNDLAKKLKYSDNTISRWEHAEITPSIETLQKISELYNISIEDIIKENITENIKENNKNMFINRLASALFGVSAVWLLAILVYIYANTFLHISFWMSYIWAMPVSCLVLLTFIRYWKNKIFGFVVSTIFIWTFISSLYLQFITYNVYLIFIVGIPIQASLSVLTFVKKK